MLRLWRWVLIAALYGLPVTVLCIVGAATVYRSGRYWWAWWLAPLCWAVAWLLTRVWRKQLAPPTEVDFRAPDHWTDRDRAAWTVVEAHQHLAPAAMERLTDPHFYLQSAIDLALAVARLYHPKAKDPIGSLTVLELMAAAELAIEDSAEWCRQYVPGSHLVTVDQWRLFGRAPTWFRAASNAAWAASVLLNPLNAGRFLISKFTTESATRQLREHALGWFYVIFVRYVGLYLIEMNSGRLRGGAARYRQLRSRWPHPPDMPATPVGDATDLRPADSSSSAMVAAPPSEPLEVRLAVVGQVKAGKSSLINALLGSSRAAVDVLPQTKEVQRYELRVADRAHAPRAEDPDRDLPAGQRLAAAMEDRLVLLDTGGYADAGATPQQMNQMHEALRGADLVLLVMDASIPARRADVELLTSLDAWMQTNLHRRLPPVLGVLTHIDCLRPIFEWDPPYDWREPVRPKEHSIAGAVAYTREQFRTRLLAVLPVCTDLARQRAWGVYETLAPALLQTLGEARGCALVRTLHAEIDQDRARALLRQLGRACTGLLRTALEGLRDAAPR